MADSGGDTVDTLGAAPETPEKRGPGRPKGLGRVPGSGRKKGTCNKDRSATIERIMREADPLGFLCKVCNGHRMEAAPEPGAQKRTWWYPTGDQRLTAAQTLARKCLPDMRATELSGADVSVKIERIERVIVDPVPAGEGGRVVEHEDAEDPPIPPRQPDEGALAGTASPRKF